MSRHKYKSRNFCKSTISQTFVILKRYSGIENDKKKLELLKWKGLR